MSPHKRTSRRLRSLGPFLAALLVPGAGAAETVVLPGHEKAVAGLVLGAGGETLPAGYAVAGIELGGSAVTVRLEGPAGEGRVALRPRGAAGPGVLLGDSGSFSVWLAPGAPSEAQRAARALLARIAARDDGSLGRRLFQTVHPAASHRPPPQTLLQPPGTLSSAWRLVRWLALFLVGAALVRRRSGTGAGAAALAAGSLFVLAVVLRWALPPDAPLHANAHGVDELRGLIGFANWGTRVGTEAYLYGAAWPQLARALLWPFDGAAAVLNLVTVLGALGPVLLWAFVRRVFPSRPTVAYLAGLALALHPAHVALSRSESPWPLAMALFLLALSWGHQAMTPGEPLRTRLLAMWAAGLALSLACELRVLTLLLPLGAALALLALGRWERGDLRRWAGPAAVVVVAAALHAAALSWVWGGAVARLPGGLAALAGPRSALIMPTLTAPTALGLMLLGAAALALLGEWRRLAALVLPGVVLLGPSLAVSACRTDLIRYQTPVHLLLLVLPGAVLLVFPRSRALGGAVAALLVAGSLPGLWSVRLPSLEAASYEAVALAAPRLPPGARVRTPPTRMADGVRSDFPEYLLASPGKGEGPCLVWIGPACYANVPPDGPPFAGDPVRPECASLVEGLDPAPSELAFRHEVHWREEEFHRIDAERPLLGFFSCPGRNESGRRGEEPTAPAR